MKDKVTALRLPKNDSNANKIKVTALKLPKTTIPKADKLVEMRRDFEAFSKYETDGHYSTVYLTCLMLGMDNQLAQQLATATEAPDTTMHSAIKYELNDTWANRFHQLNTHSLTNGFHGSDELITALLFLYTESSKINELGRLLHRYGDTYAHTELNNTEDWDNIKKVNVDEHTLSWTYKINTIVKEGGFKFLSSEDLQKKYLAGKTFKEYLDEVYLNDKMHPSDSFKMYGDVNGFIGFFFGITTEHAMTPDGSTPDYIYIRPKWYLTYVENLAYLLSIKFNLDIEGFKKEFVVFERMVTFVKKMSCSMKGIIDYEITKHLGFNQFFVPVYYASGDRAAAGIDGIKSDYLQIAKDIVQNTKSYLKERGISEKNIIVREILNPDKLYINKNGLFRTEAFQITILK